MEFASCLIEPDWEQGIACPSTHANSELEFTVVCHGDGLHALGDEGSLDKLGTVMEHRYEVKVRATLGFGSGDDRSATFLNRQVRLN